MGLYFDVLCKVGVEDVDMLIVVINSDESNMLVC